MKKAAKILCIIALVIGIIWAIVGFFGSWVGGAVISAGQEVFAEDSQGANSTLESSVNVMLKLIGSFVIVIIGGVLGIIGSDKKPSKVKPLIFGVLTLICGFILFPLANYVAAAIYLIAGLLLVLAGLTTKVQEENANKENKKLILSGIILGVLILAVGGFCLLAGSNVKETSTGTTENSEAVEQMRQDSIVDEQSSEKSKDPIIGYDKVTWGTTIQEVKQLYPDIVEKKEKNGVRRFSEKLYDNGMQYRYFYFFQDKLYQVAVDYDVNLKHSLVDKLTSIYGKFESGLDYYERYYNKHLTIYVFVYDNPSDSYINVSYIDPTVQEQIDKMKEDAIIL
ncbi:MAG TPA: DUF6056 family protein [Paludibacteraceae bacterium]|nr:DUF6056 family protein [Paludibacteraceae bacterium]HPL94453.1 DUF6056 family protein [Paludibacteraceae bacterium]